MKGIITFFAICFLIIGNFGFAQPGKTTTTIDTSKVLMKTIPNTDSSIIVIQLNNEKNKEQAGTSFLEKYLPLILSLLATVVSVFSVYYTQLRKGKLTIGLPNRFIIRTHNNHPAFEITISLLNSGVLPMVINQIYLVAKKEGKRIFSIPISEFTVNHLRMKDGLLESHVKNREISKPMILNSSEGTVLTLNFNESSLQYSFDKGEYEFELEFLLNNDIDERKKVNFRIIIDEDIVNKFYSKESIEQQIKDQAFAGMSIGVDNFKLP